jgi:acyl-CoA thioesterase-1
MTALGSVVRIFVACCFPFLAAANAAFAAGGQTRALECTAPKEVVQLRTRLPHTARTIREHRELVIVALGSSSTEGVGASDDGNAYSARFGQELKLRWLKLKVRVINSGVSGETADEMLSRFEKDVLLHRPQLVIWQVGSNALFEGEKVANYAATVRRGIHRLRSARMDVILMDPQFAPMVVAERVHLRVIEAMRGIANDLKVGLFRRFAVMRHWVSSGRYKIDDIISRDQLHMNDTSYACIAKLLADSVTTAARNAGATRTIPAP